MPALIEAVKKALPADRKAALRETRRGHAQGVAADAARARCRPRPTPGTRARSAPRGCASESGRRSRTRTGRWSARTACISSWPSRLWPMEKHYQLHRRPRRLRHRLRRAGGGRRGARQPEARPLLGQHPERRRHDVRAGRAVDGGASPHPAAERDAQQSRLSSGGHARAAHGRPPQPCALAPTDRSARRSTDPNIDYAKLAQSMGWWASGPITDPKDLAPALKRAVEVVKAGEPALVDVFTQPR